MLKFSHYSSLLPWWRLNHSVKTININKVFQSQSWYQRTLFSVPAWQFFTTRGESCFKKLFSSNIMLNQVCTLRSAHVLGLTTHSKNIWLIQICDYRSHANSKNAALIPHYWGQVELTLTQGPAPTLFFLQPAAQFPNINIVNSL